MIGKYDNILAISVMLEYMCSYINYFYSVDLHQQRMGELGKREDVRDRKPGDM